MLNNRKNIVFWIIQLFSWTSLLVIIAVTNHLSGVNIYNTVYITNLLVWIVSSFIISGLIRKYIKAKKINEAVITKRILFIISASILASIITSFITVFTYTIFIKTTNHILDNSISISITMFFIYLFWLILYFSFKLFENLQEQKIIATKLQLEKTNFELQALKQQLNPHFLFNSLNSIRALIIEDSNKARNAVTQLSNLLRTTLTNGKKNLISIDEEIKLVNNYLELEKIRYDDKLTYNIDYQKSTSLIPSFIIQLLVENAVKHGLDKSNNIGHINITIKENINWIAIIVENNGTWIQNKSGTKIGIQNIEKRLQLTYNNKANYNVSTTNNLVTTSIKIPKK